MKMLPEAICPACGSTDCVAASDDQRQCELCGWYWEADEVILEEGDDAKDS